MQPVHDHRFLQKKRWFYLYVCLHEKNMLVTHTNKHPHAIAEISSVGWFDFAEEAKKTKPSSWPLTPKFGNKFSPLLTCFIQRLMAKTKRSKLSEKFGFSAYEHKMYHMSHRFDFTTPPPELRFLRALSKYVGWQKQQRGDCSPKHELSHDKTELRSERISSYLCWSQRTYLLPTSIPKIGSYQMPK